MKTIMKAAAGALLAGGIILSTAPANAAVHIGIGVPGPVVYPAPAAYYGPPCYAYGPYACPRPAYYAPAYYGYWGPRWYGHPRYWRHW